MELVLATRIGGSGGTSESKRRGLWLFLLAIVTALPVNAQPLAGSITTRRAPFYATVVDGSGNLYSAGSALAGGLTPTPGAAQTQSGGGTCTTIEPPFGGVFVGPCDDAFVVKQDSTGKTVFATYLGGPTTDRAALVAVNSAGEVYVTGSTDGSFPTTALAALASIPAKGTFAAKLSADGSKVIYSTYLPAAMTTVQAMAMDNDGNVYVTGKSPSGHIAVVKVSPDGSAFGYYRELAGSGNDAAYAIAVDAAGDAAIAGSTTSPDFPISTGALQPPVVATFGLTEGFLVKLAPRGASLLYGTYIVSGGGVTALTVNSQGEVYADGHASVPFPATPTAPQACLASIFLIHLDSQGGFLEATYLGGDSESPNQGGLSIGAGGSLVLTGALQFGGVLAWGMAQVVFGGPGW